MRFSGDSMGRVILKRSENYIKFPGKRVEVEENYLCIFQW